MSACDARPDPTAGLCRTHNNIGRSAFKVLEHPVNDTVIDFDLMLGMRRHGWSDDDSPIGWCEPQLWSTHDAQGNFISLWKRDRPLVHFAQNGNWFLKNLAGTKMTEEKKRVPKYLQSLTDVSDVETVDLPQEFQTGGNRKLQVHKRVIEKAKELSQQKKRQLRRELWRRQAAHRRAFDVRLDREEAWINHVAEATTALAEMHEPYGCMPSDWATEKALCIVQEE